MKSVQIRSFHGPYFSVFGLNTEIYSVDFLSKNVAKRYRIRNKNNYFDDIIIPRIVNIIRIWDSGKQPFSEKKRFNPLVPDVH